MRECEADLSSFSPPSPFLPFSSRAFADGNLRSAVNFYYRAARRMKDRKSRTKLPVV